MEVLPVSSVGKVHDTHPVHFCLITKYWLTIKMTNLIDQLTQLFCVFLTLLILKSKKKDMENETPGQM